MKFKDTKYGDLTGQIYNGNRFGINVNQEPITSLEGSPKEVLDGYFSCDRTNLTNLVGGPEIVQGGFYCRENKKLTSLEGAPKRCTRFLCNGSPKLNNVKEQIIKYQIRAEDYVTDEGSFLYDDIKHLFNIGQRVTRPSMRKLLGLNDDNSRI